MGSVVQFPHRNDRGPAASPVQLPSAFVKLAVRRRFEMRWWSVQSCGQLSLPSRAAEVGLRRRVIRSLAWPVVSCESEPYKLHGESPLPCRLGGVRLHQAGCLWLCVSVRGLTNGSIRGDGWGASSRWGVDPLVGWDGWQLGAARRGGCWDGG